MSQSPTASRRLLPEGLRVLYMSSGRESFTLLTEPESGSGRCPLCDSRSAQVHSRYSRTIADLPWRGVEVKLQVRTRKFFCLNRSCERRVFCERLPDIGVRARKTGRLEQVLIKIASGLGGEAGARLARELGLLVGPDALLDRIRRMPTTDQEQVRVLGVDDFALKRGRDYGTILVDLERHKVIDLLPERSADVLAEWLEQHPGIEVVSRDRSVVYAEGIARGAPDCTQVADRWHLLKNLADTLQRTLSRGHWSTTATT